MGRPPIFTEEQVRAMGEEYWRPERPVTLDVLAQREHCARSTITRYFKLYRIPLRRQGGRGGPHQALRPEDVERIDFLYSLGWTRAEIGEVLHVAPQTVGAYMRAAGIRTRHRRDYTKAVGYVVNVSEEERERRSRVLRERWERGDMDHVAEARKRKLAANVA